MVKKDTSKIKELAKSFAVFGDENVQFKKYDSLLPKNEYDHEKAETLAEAMTELVAINKRKKYLESLLEENKALKPYLWSSLDGRVQAFHAIDETHFKNILTHVAGQGRTISKELRAEAAARGIDVPERYTSTDEYFDNKDEPTVMDSPIPRSYFNKVYRGDWEDFRK